MAAASAQPRGRLHAREPGRRGRTLVARRAADRVPVAGRRGIPLHFIEPGKLMQSVSIESLDGTCRNECLSPELFVDGLDARTKLERWRRHYNEQRPHSALRTRAPAAFGRETRGLRPRTPADRGMESQDPESKPGRSSRRVDRVRGAGHSTAAISDLDRCFLPGISRGSIAPWRRQPMRRSQLRGTDTAGESESGGNGSLQPVNHRPDEPGSGPATPDELTPKRGWECLRVLSSTYASALRASRGVRTTRWWKRSARTRPLPPKTR